MKYKYIALNPQQQTLSGSIEAKNEQDARDKLNKLQLSILTIQEVKAEAINESEFDRFNFEGRDQNDKKVVGTIAAESKLDALKRLTNEYKLNVIALYAPTATKAEQEASFKEIQKLYQQLENLEATKQKNIAVKDEEENANYKTRVREKAEQIIKQVQQFLEQSGKELKEEEKNYIKDELIHLQRIKRTENTQNLERSCSKLLSYIQEKELYLEANTNITEKTKIQLQTQQLLSELKGISTEGKFSQTGIKLKSEDSLLNKIKEALFSSKPPPPNSELIKIKQKIQTAKSEIWSYLRLIIKTKKKKYRKQALKALKPLIRKWWRYRKDYADLEDLIERKREISIDYQKNSLPLFISAWLLAFYLIAYFVFIFLTIKPFSIQWPSFFQIHQTSILMYIIIAVFLFHISVNFKFWMLKKNLPLANLSYLIASLCFGLVWLNL